MLPRKLDKRSHLLCPMFAPPVKPVRPPRGRCCTIGSGDSAAARGSTGRMYNRTGEGHPSQRHMIFQRCFQLAVAATVSITTLSLHAQSTRATTDEMDRGATTITSLTSLHSPRHAPAPFGAIDASATSSVILDVSVPPDVNSSEIGNQLQSGPASGHQGLSGSNPSQPVSNSLQGKNLQFVTGSLSAARVS
jgi:hypothetical protein